MSFAHFAYGKQFVLLFGNFYNKFLSAKKDSPDLEILSRGENKFKYVGIHQTHVVSIDNIHKLHIIFGD